MMLKRYFLLLGFLLHANSSKIGKFINQRQQFSLVHYDSALLCKIIDGSTSHPHCLKLIDRLSDVRQLTFGF